MSVRFINLPVINMKRVLCASTSCPSRRVHHERPDIPRGEQWFWVPEETPGPCYCSVECSVYGKKELEEEICLKELASASQTPSTSMNGSACTGEETQSTGDAPAVNDSGSDLKSS